MLWGEDVDYDSDGNSAYLDDPNWRELTLTRRPNGNECVDIDPIENFESQVTIDDFYKLNQSESSFDVIVVRSRSKTLLNRVMLILCNLGAIKTFEN